VVILASKLGPALSARATKVVFSNEVMTVYLEDGRRIGVPIVWFPRLVEASADQRQGWRLIGHGIGIHWEALDEDISVDGLLATRDEQVLAPGSGPQQSDPPAPKPKTRRVRYVLRDNSGRFVQSQNTGRIARKFRKRS